MFGPQEPSGERWEAASRSGAFVAGEVIGSSPATVAISSIDAAPASSFAEGPAADLADLSSTGRLSPDRWGTDGRPLVVDSMRAGSLPDEGGCVWRNW
jgi:hypothetical protein